MPGTKVLHKLLLPMVNDFNHISVFQKSANYSSVTLQKNLAILRTNISGAFHKLPLSAGGGLEWGVGIQKRKLCSLATYITNKGLTQH